MKSTSVKRFATPKATKAPLMSVGQCVIEGTRFLFCSILLVYVFVVLSSQHVILTDALQFNASWIQEIQSTALVDSLRLEWQPSLGMRDELQAQDNTVIHATPDPLEGTMT